METRVIIAGSRDFDNYDFLKSKLQKFIREHPNRRFVIVSGAARGTDKLGERFAKEKCIELKTFPAHWEQFGKSAGYIRNNEMLNYINSPDCDGYLIAFWDGKSKGTKHMISAAKKEEIPVEVFIVNN